MERLHHLRKLVSKSAAAVAAAALLAAPAPAQTQAARSIRVIVPSVVGGGFDVYARLLASELTPILGQPLVVENRPGANTNIGTEFVARSPPDGSILLLTGNAISINPAVYASLPFDPVKDLAPVALLGSAPFVIGVHVSVPAQNLAQLVALSRVPGTRMSYSSCGSGSPQHLGGELLKSMTGADLAHVPYKGCAPAIADVAAGQVQVSVSPVSTTLPHVQSGKVRPLAMTTSKRSALLPGVPTAEETGLAGYHAEQWYAMFAPARTPRETIDRLNAAIARALGNREFASKLVALGAEPAHGAPEELARVLRQDLERWGRLARAIGLKVD